MGTQSRLRTHRTSPKRRRELARLGKPLKLHVPADDNFMDENHLFRCACGKNLGGTIPYATDHDWTISTKDRVVTRAVCPKCSLQK